MKGRKAIVSAVAIVILAVISLSLFGCDKFQNPPLPGLDDIYRNYNATEGEIDTATLQMVLPDGWSVLSSASGTHADSDIGYISSLDAFIVVSPTGALSVAKVPEGDRKVLTEEDLLIPENLGVEAIKVYGEYFTARRSSNGGQVGVFNASGKMVVNFDKTSGVGSDVALSDAIRILDGELVAIAPDYENDSAVADTANANYTPVYRISTGELACRVLSGGTVSNIYGFDGKYITVERSSSSSGLWTEVYTVPATRGDNPNIAPTDNGRYTNPNGKDDYYTESLYLGDGKFYIHTEWTVNADENYTYSYDGEYYFAERYFYYPATDSRESYRSSYIFLNCVNTHYDYATGRCTYEASSSTSYNVVPGTFLKPGYTYASFGLFVGADKTAYYDQFILNSDLDIVLSLTGNFGIELEGSADREEVGYYDMMMQLSDGYAYARLQPSALRVYNSDGSLAFENDDYEFLSVVIQNGIAIALVSDDELGNVYGAFDMEGNLVIPFEYSSIEPFRSYYTYAVKKDGNKKVMLGRDGTVAPLAEGATAYFEDIATGGNTPLMKRGCYVFKSTATVDGSSTTVYGVKNMSADYGNDVVLEATLVSATIYSPASDNSVVFVYGMHETDGGMYVYRLSSSQGSGANGGSADGSVLPDWALGLICAGAVIVAAAAITVTVFLVRKRRGKSQGEKA